MQATLTWRDILARWCDPSPESAAPDLPPPLAAFLAAGGATALSSQNRFQTPLDETGWAVFYVENQGCCRWAYRTDDRDADPHVYVGEPDGDDMTYVGVGCRLDAFLSAAAVMEAVFGASSYRAGECPADRVDVLLGLTRLDLPHLGWPEVRVMYFHGGDVLAFAHLVTDEDAFVFIGARNREAIREIALRLDSSPDWTSTS